MAKDILTAVAYIIMFTMMVSLANACAGLIQIIEDLPIFRKRIWKCRSRSFEKIHKAR